MKTFGKLLGIGIMFIFSSFVAVAQLTDIVESKETKGLGRISLNFPEDGHEFTLREDKIFDWYCADNLEIGQEYCYYMKIVKMEETDNPDAVINNSAYFEFISDTIDYYWSIWFEDLDTVYFASGQHFAWQVQAYTADTVFAESKVFTFKGPPPFESFISGSRTVYTTNFTHIDENWDSLCGYGHINLYNQNPAITVPVYFENIDAELLGSYFYQRGGTIYGSYKDTFNISPDDVTSVASTQMYIDSLILTEYEAKVGCQFSPSVIIDKDTLSYQFEEWINLDGNDRPYSKFIINDTVITNDNFIFSIADSCYLYTSNYKYYPGFYGNIKYYYGTDSLDIAIPNEAKELDYCDFTLDDSIYITNQLEIAFSSGTLDCSDDKSPEAFKDSLNWRGIYLNEFKFSAVKQDSSFSFVLSDEALVSVKRASSKWLAYTEENKFIVDIDTTFANPVIGSYNYFSANYDHIKINNIDDTLGWELTGVIHIPYLKNHDYIINIPIKDNIILLAESDSNDVFQVFPLNEHELYSFGVIIDNSLYIGEIDHVNKKVAIEIPPSNSVIYFKPYFRIAGLDFKFRFESVVSETSQLTYYYYYTDVIQVVSYDGKILRYEATIDIEEEETTSNKNYLSDSKIKVYPNPAADFIQVSGLTERTIISLLDINGRELLKLNADKETKIVDISTFESGVYFVKIENSKENFSKKIIKL
ncbi:MAG: T9SS type A sorting domain-containing protein [Bacteroidales bacterium]|jgi:hypothetical protein|nr:T9SS type A sorting domain-containing protein [Bacteroidales bacterium]